MIPRQTFRLLILTVIFGALTSLILFGDTLTIFLQGMFGRMPTYVPAAVDDGSIKRSLDEQNYEAIQLLSMAVESSLSKQSRSLSRYRFGCDWTNGYWIKDTFIKYGEGILSSYGKCHVDSRQDCMRNMRDSQYIHYRWVLHKKTCEERRIPFTRQRFLQTVRNKKVLFVGDSLTRNMFQSLACLLYVENDKSRMIEHNTYHYSYPDFGVTIEYVVSNYLVKQTYQSCDSDATTSPARRPCLDINQVDEAWAVRAKGFDIVMFSTGGWWEHDLQMRQAAKGDPTYRNSRKILRKALRSVMDHLASFEFKNKQLFWRCSEVSHFFGGEWNTGGKCRRNVPSNFSEYNAVSLFIQETVIDAIATSPAKINLLDVTRVSSYRPDAHPSSQANIGGLTDCKHWCLPGVPDHWNEMWLNMLGDR